MQCKDIPEKPILEFLRSLNGTWATWFSETYDNSVQRAFPAEAKNSKLVLAKMRQMIRKGIVDGCDCGCRGDFVITQKGLEQLATKLEKALK